MSFLPIVIRELNLAAKRPMTYYFRCAGAATAIGIVLVLVLGAFHDVLPAAGLGQNVLMVLGVTGYLYVAFEGALITCDCLTEEKREGTLGLLFLTDLQGYDIVLGKMVARTWHAFGAVLAAVPAPAITFLMGGVDIWGFGRLIAALFATLIFSASLGMLFSAVCRGGRLAMVGALGALFIPWLALPCTQFAASSLPGVVGVALARVVTLPVALFLQGLPLGTGAAGNLAIQASLVDSFTWLLFLTLFASGLILAAASWVLPRSWQDETVTETRPAWFDRWREKLPWLQQAADRRVVDFTPGLSMNPSLWMAERRYPFRFASWGRVMLLLLAGVWVASRGRSMVFVLNLMGVVVVSSHYLLKLGVAMQACRALAEDRRTGGLELLLTTGLDVDDIVHGHLLALKRQFFLPAFMVMSLDAAFVLMSWAEVHGWSDPLGTAAFSTAAIAVFAVVQLADTYALAWVGLWQGFRAGSPTLAVRRAILYTLVGQWSVIGTIGLAVASLQGSPGQLAGAVLASLPFFAFSLAADASYCCRCHTGLQDQFRRVAAQVAEPHAPRRGWSFWRRRIPGPAPSA